MHHAPSGRSLSYGELAESAARQPVPDPETVVLKDESAFKIIGRSVVDPDKARIVVGRQQFGIDVKVQGMRYAVFQKGPVFDAEVRSANLDEIKAMRGVSHVFVLKGAPRQLEVAPGTTGRRNRRRVARGRRDRRGQLVAGAEGAPATEDRVGGGSACRRLHGGIR